jgi:hypothetical protein
MTAYPGENPNQDDTGPIVRHSMGLPITAGCDTTWNRTRVCSAAFRTKLQCLRTLRHSGGYKEHNKITETQSHNDDDRDKRTGLQLKPVTKKLCGWV